MMTKTLLTGLCLLFSLSVSAEGVNDKVPKMGEQTRYWLEWQSSGGAASSQPQPMSGPVAAKVYQRYIDSFSYPIPEYMVSDDADASVLGQ
ncbi:DUF3613 domain-containing protein [Methylophaga sp. OBS3]|uniref:DUF3613 domain-containing protein n=1 Tax=Methylophaga sp. OBS3 TaxID=2991934 RepID=UPI0022517CB0|nr:DUF3613 domain-containing protein [Methylophaga sp. OBS3]MCX4189645.1 DUF3613 domain-containing protein [Methylophaga sp. OBS3]